MKLKHKMYLISILSPISIIIITSIAIKIYHKKLVEYIGTNSVLTAETILNDIDRSFFTRVEKIKELSKELFVQGEIIKSAGKADEISDVNEHVRIMDSIWIATPEDSLSPLMQELITNPLARRLKEVQDFFMQEYQYHIFSEIFITDKHGANIAQTNRTSDYYQADEEWWQNTRKNGFHLGEVGFDKSAGVYSADICLKILNPSGEFLGILKAVVNIKELVHILEDFNSANYHPGQAQREFSTHVKLITNNFHILFASENYKVFERLPLYLSSQIEETKNSYFFKEGNEVGGGKIYAYAISRGLFNLSGFGWFLLVESEFDEVIEPLRKMEKLIIFLSVVVMALSILIGLLISASISKPLMLLNKFALEIGKGKLDRTFNIRSKGEIGELAQSFNKMAQELDESIKQEKSMSKAAALSAQSEKEKAKALQEANQQLKQNEEHLKSMNQQLQQKEQDLTQSQQDLKDKINNLERFNKLMIGRELTMVKLKKEINHLLNKSGFPNKYNFPKDD